MWYAFVDLLLVALGVVCVGEFGNVFWLGVLLRFARGDGGVLLCLFSVFGYAEYP